MKITNPQVIDFSLILGDESGAIIYIERNHMSENNSDRFIIRKVTNIDVTNDDVEVIHASEQDIIKLLEMDKLVSNFVDNKISDIIKNEPNDQALGFKLRKYFLDLD